MPYIIRDRYHKDYLEVKMDIEVVDGSELEEALSRWSEVADLCDRYEMENILAEMNFNNTLNIQKTFQLVTAAPQIGWKKSYRLAIQLHEDDSYLGMKFAETAMTNLGYSMKLFRQRRKALKWLLRA